MRDIKFRAWDKEFEKMTYFDDEEYDYRPPLAFRLDHRPTRIRQAKANREVRERHSKYN